MKKKINEKKLKATKISVKPFVYNIPSVSAVNIRFIVLLSIQVLMLLISKSYNAVAVVTATFLGSVIAAVINNYFRKEAAFNTMNIIIQGMFIGLLLPETFPPFTAFIISFAAIAISRCIVFKSINSWLNISTLAVIIAWYVGRTYFPDFSVHSDLITLKNTSVYLIENGTFPIYSFDNPVTNFLNKNIFSLFNVNIPEGFVSFFWDNHSLIPAFRFNLLTIISSIIIFSDNSFSLIIPSLFLAVYAILVRILVPYLFGGDLNQGDILLALFTSGVPFCAVFLIQWYGTIPVTVMGKISLGIISGIIAFLILGCGTSPVGMVYTVLFTNIFSMIIRISEEHHNELSTGKVIDKMYAKMTRGKA